MSCLHTKQTKGVCDQCQAFVCTHAVVREGRCLFCEKDGRFEVGPPSKTDLGIIADHALFEDRLARVVTAATRLHDSKIAIKTSEQATLWAVNNITAHLERTDTMRAALTQLLAIHGVEAQDHDDWKKLLDLWKEKKVAEEPICQLGIAGRRFCVLHGHDMALREGWKHGCADCGFVSLSETRDELRRVFGQKEGTDPEELLGAAKHAMESREHWNNVRDLLDLQEAPAVYAEIGRLSRVSGELEMVEEQRRVDAETVEQAISVLARLKAMLEADDIEDILRRVELLQDDKIRPLTGMEIEEADAEFEAKFGFRLPPLRDIRFIESFILSKWQKRWDEKPEVKGRCDETCRHPDSCAGDAYVASKVEVLTRESGFEAGSVDVQSSFPHVAPVGAGRPTWEEKSETVVKDYRPEAKKFAEAFEKPYRGISVAARIDDAADIGSVRALATFAVVTAASLERLEGWVKKISGGPIDKEKK